MADSDSRFGKTKAVKEVVTGITSVAQVLSICWIREKIPEAKASAAALDYPFEFVALLAILEILHVGLAGVQLFVSHSSFAQTVEYGTSHVGTFISLAIIRIMQQIALFLSLLVLDAVPLMTMCGAKLLFRVVWLRIKNKEPLSKMSLAGVAAVLGGVVAMWTLDGDIQHVEIASFLSLTLLAETITYFHRARLSSLEKAPHFVFVHLTCFIFFVVSLVTFQSHKVSAPRLRGMLGDPKLLTLSVAVLASGFILRFLTSKDLKQTFHVWQTSRFCLLIEVALAVSYSVMIGGVSLLRTAVPAGAVVVGCLLTDVDEETAEPPSPLEDAPPVALKAMQKSFRTEDLDHMRA